MSYLDEIVNYKNTHHNFVNNIIHNLRLITQDLICITDNEDILYFSYHKNINSSWEKFPIIVSIKTETDKKFILLGVFDRIDDYNLPEKIKNTMSNINEYLYIINNHFAQELPKLKTQYYYYSKSYPNDKKLDYPLYPEEFILEKKLKAI